MKKGFGGETVSLPVPAPGSLKTMSSETRQNSLLKAIKDCQSRLKGFIAKRAPFSEVDDIFQEIVVNLFRADSLSGPIEAAASWLFRAARNEIIDRRRKSREELILDGVAEESWLESEEISEVMLAAPDSAEDQYLRSLFWERFHEALDGLPEAQREVFVQTELNGKSYNQLSEELQVPVNTLLSRKHKAVLSLRLSLAELYELIVGP
jgi:RNA polymerase sigma factor (sigma-70 family)